MSLYLFLIFFAIGATVIGAIIVLVFQTAAEEHEEDLAVEEHIKEQYEAIAAARGTKPEPTNSVRRHHHQSPAL